MEIKEVAFKEAGVLLARLRVGRRQTRGIEPSRTMMARPGKEGVNAERAAGTICHMPLVAEKRAKARRFPMPRLSYVAKIFCSAGTPALNIDRCTSDEGVIAERRNLNGPGFRREAQPVMPA